MAASASAQAGDFETVFLNPKALIKRPRFVRTVANKSLQ
jgi:hypothetical protein